MAQMEQKRFILEANDPILITGATGFIGSRLVKNLLDRGFRNLRCFSRPSSRKSRLRELDPLGERIQLVEGNLLSPADCRAATKDVAVIYHLAAGRGEKSVPDAFMNSVVTTRNLLEAAREHARLKRFVNISSFAVYTNTGKPHGRLLDENCPVETHPERRADAYDFAKVKQDEMVAEYGKQHGIPYVMVRPGYVFGPGNKGITGRVGIATFGIFLHLGGMNTIPFTYVDNCADAIALAGLVSGVDGEVFNVVDDELPTSRKFLRLYKKNVKRFRSLYVPHAMSYSLCYLWDWYCRWSEGQLPTAFNTQKWHSFWKSTRYSNAKVKQRLGWAPAVPMAEGFRRYFEACRGGEQHG
jgi:nucleoside-diphosphate-sugar epimerase